MPRSRQSPWSRSTSAVSGSSAMPVSGVVGRLGRTAGRKTPAAHDRGAAQRPIRNPVDGDVGDAGQTGLDPHRLVGRDGDGRTVLVRGPAVQAVVNYSVSPHLDRKSTRLNSSHANISYAVFCLKK